MLVKKLFLVQASSQQVNLKRTLHDDLSKILKVFKNIVVTEQLSWATSVAQSIHSITFSKGKMETLEQRVKFGQKLAEKNLVGHLYC